MLFQLLGAAGDVTARADTRDHHVDRRIGKIVENLLRGGPHMHRDVRGILELLRHPCAGGLLDELLRALDRALHALFARGQVEGRAISQHQPPPFDRHAFGHHENELIALDRRDHRQAHAGIARCRLDDRAAGLERAIGLRRLDHGERDSVLDRSARVRAFGLDPDLRVTEQPVDADVRRLADGFENVGSDHVEVSPASARLYVWRCQMGIRLLPRQDRSCARLRSAGTAGTRAL